MAFGGRGRDSSLGVIRERMTPLPQNDNFGEVCREEGVDIPAQAELEWGTLFVY